MTDTQEYAISRTMAAVLFGSRVLALAITPGMLLALPWFWDDLGPMTVVCCVVQAGTLLVAVFVTEETRRLSDARRLFKAVFLSNVAVFAGWLITDASVFGKYGPDWGGIGIRILALLCGYFLLLGGRLRDSPGGRAN
jgi:hypothetical protein